MSTRAPHARLGFVAGAALALALRVAVSALDDATLYMTATASALVLAACAWWFARRHGQPAHDPRRAQIALGRSVAAFGAGSAALLLLLDAITPRLLSPVSSAARAAALADAGVPHATLHELASAWDGAGHAAAFALSGAAPALRGGASMTAPAQDARAFGLLLRDATFAVPLARAGGERIAALCERGLPSLAFARPHARVWLAGAGGGLELACARHYAADSVDVSEPSAALRAVAARARIEGERDDPGTHVHWHAEHPRAFARMHAQRYDLVLLPAQNDPAHSWPAGLLPLREASLETDAGLALLLDALADGGALFATLNGEPAALRFAATARAALLRLGAAHPESHFAVHQSGDSYGVLVKRAPFVLDEVLDMHQQNRTRNALGELPWFDALVLGVEQPPVLRFTPGAPFRNRFGQLLAPTPRAGVALARNYVFDLAPAEDARPLFYASARTDLPQPLSLHAAARVLPMLALLALALVLALGAGAGASLAAAPGARLRALAAPIATACAQFLAFGWAQHAAALWLAPAHAFACAAIATALGAWAGVRAGRAGAFAQRRALLFARAIALVAVAMIGVALEPLLERCAALGAGALVFAACAALFALGAGIVLPSALAIASSRQGAPSPAWLAFAHAAGLALALPLAATLVLFASYQALLIGVAALLATLVLAALRSPA